MASYIQGDDRGQTMLLPPRVEEYVSDNDPVRAIDAFVDSLDLAGLGFKVRVENSEGRSSYHPGTLLKLLLWGYFKRTRSSRELEAACAVNLQVLWLTRCLRPDHSTICQFRKDHPVALKNILRQFNLVCIELKLFGQELIAIDGTFVTAINSSKKSFTKGRLKKLIEVIDAASERYLTRLTEAESQPDPVNDEGHNEVAELKEKLEAIRTRKSELEGLLDACATSATGQVNLTDPDSRQLFKRGKITIGYNVQTAVDAKHDLIVTIETTQEGTDHHLLDPMAQQAKADLLLAEDAPLNVYADRGYANAGQLAQCESHGTLVTAAQPENKSHKNGLYNVSDFTFDPTNDTYTCPNEAVLNRKADRTEKCGHRFQIYSNVKACKSCPLRSQCTEGESRKFAVSVHRETLAKVQARLEANPDAMQRRAAIVEHPFGTIKIRNGYGGGLLCRGKEMAAAEMGLSAWAYNFIRVLKLVSLPDLIAELMKKRSLHPATTHAPKPPATGKPGKSDSTEPEGDKITKNMLLLATSFARASMNSKFKNLKMWTPMGKVDQLRSNQSAA